MRKLEQKEEKPYIQDHTAAPVLRQDQGIDLRINPRLSTGPFVKKHSLQAGFALPCWVSQETERYSGSVILLVADGGLSIQI